MSRFYKILIVIFSIILALGLSFTLYIQFWRYQFDEKQLLEIQNPQIRQLHAGNVLNLMFWNISYGGMPDEIDFFYSGGTQLMISQEKYEKNFSEIRKQIELAKDTLDFLFLQKIDTSSKRSYFNNQVNEIREKNINFESTFCLNFSIPFIPVPLDQPIGKVHSGLMTFSRYQSKQSLRLALSSRSYYWPKRLFTAQRCMSLSSYEVGTHYLHIINAHLDSYDYRGKIRLAQLQQVWNLADSLEQKGDYVIVVGGWNMSPPGFKKFRIKNGYLGKPAYPEIDSSKYFKNWKFEYRMDIPTNRSTTDAYRHGAISTSIKDFFICSPNIAVLGVNTADQQFKYSDHHAIFIKVFLFPK